MNIKVGIIGAGRMGAVHAGNVVRHRELELVSVFDNQPHRAREFADSFGIACARSMQALLKSGVDAVVVASVADAHASAAVAAARAGKAIYLEKPIDLDMRLAVETADEIRRSEVPAMVGFNRRFDPRYRGIRDAMLARGSGRVQLIRMSSRGPNEAPPLEYVMHAGGIYRDKTIHFFDLVRFLAACEIEAVSATGSVLTDPHVAQGADVDTCVVQLRLQDGALCQIDNARRAVYGFDERVEVMTTDGLFMAGSADAGSVADAAGIMGSKLAPSFMARFAEAFAGGMDAFADLICGRDGVGATLDDALAAQLVAEAAALSAEAGQAVSVSALAERFGIARSR